MASKFKKCSRCKQLKLLSDFSAHKSASDGKQAQCKSCAAERARLGRVGKPCISCGKPKGAGVPKGARICSECAKTCFDCGERPRKARHRRCEQCAAARERARVRTPEQKVRGRISRIASVFKVRKPLAAALAATTFCHACGSRPEKLHIDHCHATNAVRGVLCFGCNAALGHVQDSPQRLTALLRYLEQRNSEGFKKMDDALKARHYLDLQIELEERKDETANRI